MSLDDIVFLSMDFFVSLFILSTSIFHCHDLSMSIFESWILLLDVVNVVLDFHLQIVSVQFTWIVFLFEFFVFFGFRGEIVSNFLMISVDVVDFFLLVLKLLSEILLFLIQSFDDINCVNVSCFDGLDLLVQLILLLLR